ncbi:conserved mitochondrial Peptidase C14 (caspase) domain-containing protein [Andalucia godoyi]|uniref:Conserved mitochondrial Peptidase C14 (Caspase) domain-containing protein n=1 Tax=Andalucia godoyi TaxID=505711 RepID=A0A8K0AI64_ANDGO|nr:conserved mitochondrial Peptidase C14 (caspase) domain-containing protein [Andalucia godoyi]|eukprot:ANDGO_06234.mRNA.1 conserved mitochondrial Peptidase C14 (caspase) domain-containing protein
MSWNMWNTTYRSNFSSTNSSRGGIRTRSMMGPVAPAVAKKAALIIGINYSRDPEAKLSGCVNDTSYVRRMLREQFGFTDGDMYVLTDPVQPGSFPPTKANILKYLRKLVDLAVNEGYTELFLEYSGHGSHIDDEDGDEEDGQDEVLVPMDYKTAGFIKDDELMADFLLRLPKTVRLTVLMDCCHSGTMLDLPFSYKGNDEFSRASRSVGSIACEVRMLSGCQDSQTSADAFNLFRDKNASGALTWAFLTTLKANKFKISWLRLLDEIRLLLKRERMTQVAELCASSQLDRSELFTIVRGMEQSDSSSETPSTSTTTLSQTFQAISPLTSSTRPPTSSVPASHLTGQSFSSVVSDGPSIFLEQPRKRMAVLIGINYSRDPAAKLNGCVNDTNYVKRMLKEHFSFKDNEIYQITDPTQPGSVAPTKANILKYLKLMVDFAIREKTVDLFLEYSGHGSHIDDEDGDEEDGQDEVLVPMDYQQSGFITDDYLIESFLQKLPSTCRLTVLMDCCHSGTILDLPKSYVKGKLRTNNKSVVKASVRMLSGCQDDQTSADAFNLFRDKNASGALTWALLSTLKNSNYKITWMKLIDMIRELLKKQKMTQYPELSFCGELSPTEEFEIVKKTTPTSQPMNLAVLSQTLPTQAKLNDNSAMQSVNMSKPPPSLFQNTPPVQVPSQGSGNVQPQAAPVVAPLPLSSLNNASKIQQSQQCNMQSPSPNDNTVCEVQHPPRGKKMALLIGINYAKDASAKLNGCVNDTNYIRRMLKEQFGFKDHEIIALTDPVQPHSSAPTKANIMKGLKKIVDLANSGEYTDFFLEYSGHGSHIDDEDGDEEDGQDEVLVPLDYQKAGFITDDFLSGEFLQKLPAKCRLTVLMDCCHSGSMMDLAHKYANGKFSKVNVKPVVADVRMLSGCQDHQTSADAFNLFRDKNASGALTWALLTCLKQNNYRVPWVTLIDQIRALLKREKMVQIAELTSAHPIRPDDEFCICSVV